MIQHASVNGGLRDEGGKSPSTIYYPKHKYKQKNIIKTAHKTMSAFYPAEINLYICYAGTDCL